jgi:hypothetical protein
VKDSIKNKTINFYWWINLNDQKYSMKKIQQKIIKFIEKRKVTKWKGNPRLPYINNT